MKMMHPAREGQLRGSTSERDPLWRLHNLLPLLLALLAYGLAAVLLFQNASHFEGDEPHYQLMAGSLCRDGDADLANNYRAQDYLSYFPHASLEPHALDYRGNGELRSVHGLGLPLLLIIPHCILGHPYWARLEMAVLAALASWSIFLTIRDWTKRPRLAYATWAAVTFTMPMWTFASQVYPDVAAALGVAIALQLFLSRPLSNAKALGIGLVLALLPWLHIRFAVLSLLIVISTAVTLRRARRNWKAFACLLWPVAISGLLWMWNSYVWYGGILPQAGYQPWFQQVESFTWDRVYLAMTSLVLGREFGLIPYAPIYLLALVGMVMMVLHRKKVPLAPLIWLLGYILAVVLSQAAYRMDQGYSFPARMLLPITPLLAMPLAYSLWRARWLRILGLVLFVISVIISVQGLLQPYKAFANQSGLGELPLLRPVQGIYPALQDTPLDLEFDLSETAHYPGELTHDQTTGAQVILADPQVDEPGYMAFGPYSAFQTGQYIATIGLGRGEADASAVVASIDVVADGGRRVLAGRDIYAHEFSPGPQPQAFSLSFSTRDTWPIEVRVYYTGQSRLWLQSVTIRPLTGVRTTSYPGLPIVVGWGLVVVIIGLLAARSAGPRHIESAFDDEHR